MTFKRWHKSRKNQLVIGGTMAFIFSYYVFFYDGFYSGQDLDLTRRYIQNRLAEALKEDKGTGCQIPKLDPFAKEVTQFDKSLPKIVCGGKDWVRCNLSLCSVVEDILSTTKNILCTYRYIIYLSDASYVLGPPVTVKQDGLYLLTKSDHVKIACEGIETNQLKKLKWAGHAAGFRSSVHPLRAPPGREDTFNVLILGFDSTSHNGFIRKMPKSYKYLKEIKATILNGYNIVGDGTPAALFPILTGKTELELPEARKSKNKKNMDSMPFIFKTLREDGYRTSYFEDMPWIGTFQYRFNGFKRQPADHYLRPFFMEESSKGRSFWGSKSTKYCVGDTPRYSLMLNLTRQFFQLDGKKYGFTFIADITHDDFNMISSADDGLEEFLRDFVSRGWIDDTMLMVMGDHGPRYAAVRDTIQGKLEERLPLMAILLPHRLRKRRPEAQASLETNAERLTTPHDIYATVLDAIDLTERHNLYKVTGADLTRGLSLLEPVPKNRSCSEAGIEAHWCSCLRWHNVSTTDPFYHKTAQALLDHLNSITYSMRSKCVERTLTTTEWVMKQVPNTKLLSFSKAKDVDGYVGVFGAKPKIASENYQLKIVVGPGKGVYEAMATYLLNEDRFIISDRDISRTNAYGDEPKCISDTQPHLNKYCYCKD